jgi:hypothetical protein
MLVPICLFVYNRLSETQKTVEALKSNYLAPESDLFIFADGAKDKNDREKVDKVRQYLKSINGFKQITIFESSQNKGLANSIISGVTQIIKKYGSVIVVEDDLITAPNFLDFMNQALFFYKDNMTIHSIGGYTFNLPCLKNCRADYYVGYRVCSWGWATWKDRWDAVDWDIKTYSSFKYNIPQIVKFNRGGSDMFCMLRKQIKGKIDSWAIRWAFDLFQKDMLAIYPVVSKVINKGFGVDATHTHKTLNRFEAVLDDGKRRNFIFSDTVNVDKLIIKEFRFKFSVINRVKDRFRFNSYEVTK